MARLRRVSWPGLALCLSGLVAPPALAWGPEGHGAIGVLAVEQLEDGARTRLQAILGTLEPQPIVDACNRPDAYRESAFGQWSGPLHYVNIPHGARTYSARRDCPNGQCVTAAVVDYARELGNAALSRSARQQAFGFLCHFTGDIHQPLHVGYADDRGGNLVTVVYREREIDLHHLWDERLIDYHQPNWKLLVEALGRRPDNQDHPRWQPGEVTAWTNESFELTRHFAYPPRREIDSEFEEQAWRVVQNQLATAAARLAGVLEVVLEDGP